MPAQKKTSLGLNQWIGSEYPKRIDFVEDNKIINDELENRVKYTDLAEENKAGIITYAKIKEITPKPDLSPYVRFDSASWNPWDGRSSTSNNEAFLKGSYSESWGPGNHHMYRLNKFNDIDAYITLHVGKDRLYYRHNARNGNNFVYFIDNLDIAARDVQIQSLSTNVQQIASIYVRDLRLAGYLLETGTFERAGYVLTFANEIGNNIVQYGRRALQQNKGGTWYNVPFA